MNSSRKANKFMFYLMVYLLLMPIGLGFMLSKLGIDSSNVLASNIIVVTQDFLLFVLPVCVYLFLTRQNIVNIVPHKIISIKNIALIVVLALLFQPFMSVLGVIASIFVDTDASTETIHSINNLPFTVSVIALAVLPAICEETVFRGIIMTGYKKHSPQIAIVVSSLFFGFMHQNLYQFSYAAITGVFLAILVYYTNSIYSSIIAHFIINGTQVVMTKTALLFDKTGAILEQMGKPLSNADIMTQLTSSTFMSLITMPIFLVLIWKFMKRNKQNALDYTQNIDSESLYIDISSMNGGKTKFFDIYFVGTIIVAGILFAYSFIAGTKA